jgi:hypothetical protein
MPMLPVLMLSYSLFLAAAPTTWPESGVYVGDYEHGFEMSKFTPDADKAEHWWLKGKIDCPDAPGKKTAANRAPTLHLEVRGTLGPGGQYGHMGRYMRELTVQEVLVCKAQAY